MLDLSLNRKTTSEEIVRGGISYNDAEAQKPRQRVSVANRKIFARPENFCAYDIKGHNFVSILSGRF